MLVWHVWDMYDEVDRLHVKRNGIVGMNYLVMQLDVLLLSFEEKGDATIFLSSDHLSLTLSLPPSLCVCVCGSESA